MPYHLEFQIRIEFEAKDDAEAAQLTEEALEALRGYRESGVTVKDLRDTQDVKYIVTLEFPDRRHKDEVMGQLSDGWGENYVALEWDRSKKFEDTWAFKIRAEESETFREDGWHLQKKNSAESPYWFEVDGNWSTRSAAIMASMKLEKENPGVRYKVKEDFE